MKYHFTAMLSLVSLLAFAQSRPVKEKAKNYYFYKKDGTEISKPDSADIIQVVSEPDAGEDLYNVQEFYKNGKTRFIGKSSVIHPLIREGQGVYFYPNGRKSLVSVYKNGQLSEAVYRYYPNGKLYLITSYFYSDSLNSHKTKVHYLDSVIKANYDSLGTKLVDSTGTGYLKRYNANFATIAEEGSLITGKPDGIWKGYDPKYHMSFVEKYDKGKLLNGEATDSLDHKKLYDQRIKAAGFNGGMDYFLQSLASNVHYPRGSRDRGIQGTTIICFTVDKDGTFKNFKTLKPVATDIESEAVREIKTYGEGVPAEIYGIKVPWIYVMKIKFSLEDQFHVRIDIGTPVPLIAL